MAARRRIASRRNWPPNLYLNSRGYYWFRHPVTGKAIGLGRDFQEASAQARTANAELERRKGAVSILEKLDVGIVSLESWCDTYFDERKDGNHNTVAALKSHIKAIKEDRFSAQPIASITPKQVSDFLKATAANRGAPTAKLIRGKLLDIFRAAIENRLVEVGRNPVEVTKRPRHQVTRQRLTLDDFLAIRNAAAEKPEHRWFVNAMNLALVSGQRREDISAMRFDQVKNGFLWVEQAKTSSKLMIPLSLRLNALGMTLEDVIKASRDNVVSKSIIHQSARGARIAPGQGVSVASLSNAFKRFRDLVKIKLDEGRTPPTFHEIRSLSARLYAEQHGKEFAQALLGHKSAAMTDLYRDSRGLEWSEVKLTAR